MGPVRGDGPELSGFVIVLDDATSDRWARDLRDELLRGTVEEGRGRLAAITGAVETLRQYGDLEPSDIERFRSIIAEESGRLADFLHDVQERHSEAFGSGWELADMLGHDLLWAVQQRIEDTTDLDVVVNADEGCWVRVDAGGLIHILVEVSRTLAESDATKRIELSLAENDRFVALELAWPGDNPLDDAIWESVAEGGDLATIARRHGGEAWVKPGDFHTLTVLLPAGSAIPAIAVPVPAEDRPTSYDFRLLSRNAPDAELAARPLGDLTYTVFDLETTGLEPSRGDEIVSIGAVRILHGMLLSHESFDCLVDPQRSISESSMAIHGITPDMVRGQPTIGQVLPHFSRFVDTTVLVGHNVAFDMKFLELLRPSTGIEFTSPVLDTLLLAELAFGESAAHSLEWLSSRLGVDITGRHTALGDSLVTAEVFLKLIPLLETKGLVTLGEVTAAAAKTKYANIEY
jgi:DNA polymerase-3 subunit epsilon